MICDIEIEKHNYKSPIFLEDLDIENVLVSGGKNCKYCVGYLHDNYKIKPLI